MNPKDINPRGPSQRYPDSAGPITNDPKNIDQSHQKSDIDSSVFAQHHTLGPNPNQSSPGDHVHDGSNSKLITDLEILNSLIVDGIFTAGNIAWGQVTITPSAANTPTSAPISFNIKGSTFIGLVTANTSVPGTTVTGIGINGISATGATVWLTRANTTATGVFWAVIGI